MDRKLARRIEDELTRFHDSLKLLQELRESVIDASPSDEAGPVSKMAGDPTQNKALRLVDDGKIVYLTRMTNAIADVLDSLPAEKQRLVELRYFRGYPAAYVADELHISQSTFHNWKNEIIDRIAWRRGFTIPSGLSDLDRENCAG